MNKENSIVIDLNKIFKILFTKKVAILKSPFLNILILVSIYFFYPSSYQSSFVLMPTSGKNVSSYEQAAVFLGIDNNANSEETLNTPDIIEELLKSRKFSDSLMYKKINTSTSTNIDVVDFLMPNYKNYNLEESFRLRLKNSVKISKDIETGIYNINVITNDALASFNLCNIVLNNLLDLRKEILLSLTMEKKEFLNEQIKFLYQERELIELKLKTFLDSNSRYTSSPILTIEYSNMVAENEMASKIYWAHRQDLQLLLLQEIGQISDLLLIDEPNIMEAPYYPTKSTFITLFFVTFFLLNIPFFILSNYFKE